MFESRLEVLQKKRGKAMSIFIQAKDNLTNIIDLAKKEIALKKEEIDLKLEEIEKDKALIKDFNSEKDSSMKMISNIDKILE